MKRTENRQNEQTAAIMARVSLEKQAREGYSLPAQVEIGTVIATKFGLVTNDKYVLVDAGYSGDDWDRPSIAKGLELLRTRKVVALIFTVSDRFARDVEGASRLYGKSGRLVDASSLETWESTRMKRISG